MNSEEAFLYQLVESPLLEFGPILERGIINCRKWWMTRKMTLSTAPAWYFRCPCDRGTHWSLSRAQLERNGGKDSAWETFSKETNFGNGAQTIVVNKVTGSLPSTAGPIKDPGACLSDHISSNRAPFSEHLWRCHRCDLWNRCAYICWPSPDLYGRSSVSFVT